MVKRALTSPNIYSTEQNTFTEGEKLRVITIADGGSGDAKNYRYNWSIANINTRSIPETENEIEFNQATGVLNFKDGKTEVDIAVEVTDATIPGLSAREGTSITILQKFFDQRGMHISKPVPSDANDPTRRENSTG